MCDVSERASQTLYKAQYHVLSAHLTFATLVTQAIDIDLSALKFPTTPAHCFPIFSL